ncbi:MAG: hypothetical protein GWO11_00960 [Desulfuromonadales bacterium]|nr:hypothetical protein [Desulfuromonadales bacterium]NIR33080.1 hypothetical protein [Desulfuromonadales bacterium]NIS39318.1 hypothetical protein [Desulfuromonadales bacterium]
MNAMQVRGQWNQVRGEIRSRWHGMRGNPLGRFNGRLLKMMGRFQYNCGTARKRAGKRIGKKSWH